MTKGEHAVFSPRQTNEREHEAPYRTTIFVPQNGDEKITPFVRARYGEPPEFARSAVWFKKGEPFAGSAWCNPGDVTIYDGLPSLRDCGGSEQRWRKAWIVDGGVEPRVAEAMGAHSGYIKHTRSIATFAIMPANTVQLVVCVDSTRSNGFLPEFLLPSAAGGRGPARVTAVFRRLGHMISHLEMSAREVGMKNLGVFISHAGIDRKIANIVIEYLEGCLELPSDGVRCTSVAGYKLKIGARTDEVLKTDLAGAKVIVGILTPASIASGWVVMELGAGWGRSKAVCCILHPKVKFDRIPGPLKGTHAGRMTEASCMTGLVDVISAETHWPKRNDQRRDEALVSFKRKLGRLT